MLFRVMDGGGIGVVSDIKELQDKSTDKDDKTDKIDKTDKTDETDDDSDDKKDGKEEGDKEDDGDKDGEDKDSERDEELEEDEDTEEDDEKEEDDELEEEEEEEETEEEKELEQVTRAADIKKTYPDFFKKFPDLKATIYRELQFSQVFASPKDAQVAAERADILGKIENDVINDGNPDKFLKVVADTNKDSFSKLALRVLPYLQKEHKELYYEAAAVPIKQLLRAAFREGNGKDGDLGRAALYIHRYFFGDLNLDSKTKGEGEFKEEKESDEKKQYRERLAQIDAREVDNFSRSVDNSYISKMSRLIREGLDKEERLTEYNKAKLTEDILRGVRKQMESDPRYMGQIKSLFGQAKNNNYPNDFKSRIINTALARAKSLVPGLRAKLVSEALGGKKKGKEEASKGKDRQETRREYRKSQGEYNRDSRENRGQEKLKKPLTDIDILRAR